MKKCFVFLMIITMVMFVWSCQGGDKTTGKDKSAPSTSTAAKIETKPFEWKEIVELKDVPEEKAVGKYKGKEWKSPFIQFDEEDKSTVIYIVSEKPSEPCKSMHFSDSKESISFEIDGRIKPGQWSKKMDDTKNASIKYLKPGEKDSSTDYVNLTYVLDVKEIKENTIVGKLAICLKDTEKTYLAGSFQGEYCKSRYQAVDAPPTVNGAKWDMAAYKPESIPATPIQGTFIGFPFDIKYIKLDDKKNEYSLIFSNKKPANACDWTMDEDKLEINSKKPLKNGTFIANSKNAKDQESWHVWFSYPQLHNRGPMSYNPFWNFALTIESIDKEKKLVKGKVIVACDDPAKTMVAGSFEAEYCAEK